MSGSIRIRDVSAYLFVIAEAVAWFAVLFTLGTATVRSSFDRLASQIEPLASLPSEGRAAEAFAIARDGAEHATGGPSLLIVVVAALAAFILVRMLAEGGLPLALNAVVGLAASMVALHVLVHVAVHGDLRVWEQSALATMLDSSFSGDVDATTFIADPDPGLVRSDATLLVAVVGLTALWVRFLIAGRAPITYERALQSFTIGFSVVLLAAIVGQGVGTDVPSFIALLHFVVGALSLAAAHVARTRPAEETVGRDAPMALAALATLGAIVLAALLFGLLAALDVQRAFDPVFDLILAVIGRVMLVLLTPVFWVVNWLLEHIFGSRGLQIPQNLRRIAEEGVPREEEGGVSFLPGWTLQVIRVLAVAAVIWLLYRVSRLIFHLTRGRRISEERDEVRSSATGGAGVGSLLRGLFGGRSRSALSGDWLRRHAIYRLYARVVSAARDRGVERAQGDTPIEFAERAGARLEAEPFAEIGLAFDRARYGRHYPSEEAVEALERALREWERRASPQPRGGGTTAG